MCVLKQSPFPEKSQKNNQILNNNIKEKGDRHFEAIK